MREEGPLGGGEQLSVQEKRSEEGKMAARVQVWGEKGEAANLLEGGIQIREEGPPSRKTRKGRGSSAHQPRVPPRKKKGPEKKGGRKNISCP